MHLKERPQQNHQVSFVGPVFQRRWVQFRLRTPPRMETVVICLAGTNHAVGR